MQIGSIDIPHTVALAPMAGVTDYAYRTLCGELGLVYTITEMVSAKALCFGDKKTKTLLKIHQNPAAVQIFGSDPESMEKGVALALEYSGAAVLDINMGCPTPKILRGGDGCALMRRPELAEAVAAAAVRAAGHIPVTVKMRLGWDSGERNALELGKRLENAGVAAITVHGRTKTQMYSGRADWEAIRDIRGALTIPVIANGDIFGIEEALRCRRITGCAMLMAGRGCFGRPWLPRDIHRALTGQEALPEPTRQEVLGYIRRHFDLLLEDKPQRVACLEMRKHLCWYVRGWRDAVRWRHIALTIDTPQDFTDCLRRMEAAGTTGD